MSEPMALPRVSLAQHGESKGTLRTQKDSMCPIPLEYKTGPSSVGARKPPKDGPSLSPR